MTYSDGAWVVPPHSGASGGAALNDRGAWAASTAYAAGDTVTYIGARWACKTAHASTASFDFTKFTRSGSAAIIGRGYMVPAGSLDTFKAAFKANASSQFDVVIIGDSTSFGNDDDESTYYPWVKRLKANAIAAGVVDGGHGLFHANDYTLGAQTTFADPDGYPLVTATTGTWTAASAFGVNGFANSTSGNTITFQGTGTAIRVNMSKAATATKIGVTIDGGTETVYDGMLTASLNTAPPYDTYPVAITGLTEGVHTVIVRNAGPSSIKDTSVAQAAMTTYGGAGGPSAGTYYYVITAVSANGESTAGAPLQVTVDGAHVPQITFYPQTGWTSVKLYRGTSSSGPFGLVNTQASLTVGAVNSVSDSASATPGANPPGTSALGTYASSTTCEFGIEFFRTAAGVTFHKEASSGAVMSNYFDHKANGAGTRSYTPIRLGLKTENQGTSVNSPYFDGAATGPRPQYRNVKLTIIQIGTNDIGSGGPATDGSTQTNWDDYFENLAFGIRTARAAGSDVLIVSPPFTDAVSVAFHYAGRFKATLYALAMAHGCAYADFQEALGWDTYNWPARGVNNHGGPGYPHLHISAYQAEADFLWANIIYPILEQA